MPETASTTRQMPMQLLNTLYVNTPDSWLRLDNDMVRVVVDDETRLRVLCTICRPWCASAGWGFHCR